MCNAMLNIFRGTPECATLLPGYDLPMQRNGRIEALRAVEKEYDQHMRKTRESLQASRECRIKVDF